MTQHVIPALLAIAMMAGGCSSALALEAASDQELAAATGAGVAILPENFSLIMQDEDASYINLIPRGQVTVSGQSRADIYIRNLAITRNDATTTRASDARIRSWGSGDNPFVIVVKTVTAPNYTGTSALSYLELQTPNYCPNGTTDTVNCAAGPDSGTALDAYNIRLGAMIDLLLKQDSSTQGYGGRTGNSVNGSSGVGLQLIWNGLSINGSRLAVFQTPSGSANATDNGTLGVRGVIRLNTNSTPANSGLTLATRLRSDFDTSREFITTEGLSIGDLDINLPLGAPNYQALTFGAANAGNFYMELTRIPNNAAAYNQAYINYANATDVANKTCTSASCGTASVPATHGTVVMRDTVFKVPGSSTVSLGHSRIDGIFIQHMKLTTTGL